MATVLFTMGEPPKPAVAHGPCSISSDSGTANGTTDFHPATSPWSDGYKVRFRILRPVNCSGKPATGWPLIVSLHGGGGNRCTNDNYARSETAKHGYVVLSFTARGSVTPEGAGNNPTAPDPVSGCTQLTDQQDALDDDGGDVAGPRDRRDISQLIDWLAANNSFSGCSNPCADTNKVGIHGGSYGGLRTWMMGVPSPTNPQFDSRVKAIAPGWAWLQWQNIKALSNDGAATPTYRPVGASGFTGEYTYPRSMGLSGHYHSSVLKYTQDRMRGAFLPDTYSIPSTNTTGAMTNGSAVLTISGSPGFTSADVGAPVTVAGAASASGATLNTTIASYTSATQVTLATSAAATVSGKRVSWGAQAFWDQRILVDDDPAVDKASLITMPTFVVADWLDQLPSTFTHVQIEAWKKLNTTDKYLYLGSCSSHSTACHENNRVKIRDAMHRFFDKYLKGATTAVGGPIFYTIPPKYVSDTNNPWTPSGQTWTEQTASTWPPGIATTWTGWFRNNGTLQETPESGTTCTPGSTGTHGAGCSEVDNKANLPITSDICLGYIWKAGGTYGSTEGVAFDTPSFTSDGKVVQLDADLWVSTRFSTRLQVNVDLFDVDSTGAQVRRVWQGPAQVQPVVRNATPDTPYRLVFNVGGAAWTVAQGHLLRVVVTSKFAWHSMPEPLPDVYRLWHNETYQSKITLTGE
ncbi:MAG TPA: CocE/NonD family hydrolase [Acidimicrobiales bacterium]|nr:CocE/NonD family hydrolase [Acidimicrobiales bacterium]